MSKLINFRGLKRFLTNLMVLLNSKSDKGHIHSAKEIEQDTNHRFVTDEQIKQLNLLVQQNKDRQTYIGTLKKETASIKLPSSFSLIDRKTVVFIDGLRLTIFKHYTVEPESNTIFLKESYAYETDIEIEIY